MGPLSETPERAATLLFHGLVRCSTRGCSFARVLYIQYCINSALPFHYMEKVQANLWQNSSVVVNCYPQSKSLSYASAIVSGKVCYEKELTTEILY